MSIDDLSDDEEDVLRALRRMAQIEACYRVPPHLVPAARHLQRKGLVREVAWQGPCPPACGTALELLPTGVILAARLPRADGRLHVFGRPLIKNVQTFLKTCRRLAGISME